MRLDGIGLRRDELEAVDVDDSLGEGLWGFLREVVSDAAFDDAECIFAGEFFAIAAVVVCVWCAVSIALKHDCGHRDNRTLKEPLFKVVIPGFPLSQVETPAVVMDDYGNVIGVVEGLCGAIVGCIIKVPLR